MKMLCGVFSTVRSVGLGFVTLVGLVAWPGLAQAAATVSHARPRILSLQLSPSGTLAAGVPVWR
jgi:hypothetical protein